MIPTPNLHSVPQDQWAKWCAPARATFNRLYSKMEQSQELYKHPDAPRLTKEHWETVAWNAAWTAADAIAECDKALVLI